MPKFLIERELPGAGQLTADQLRAISQTSCGVLQEMGPQIQWLQSYVTGDKRAIIDPTTAESPEPRAPLPAV